MPMLLFAHWYILYIVWCVCMWMFHQCFTTSESMILRFIQPFHIRHIHFTIWAFIRFYTQKHIIVHTTDIYIEYLWIWCNSWLSLLMQYRSNQFDVQNLSSAFIYLCYILVSSSSLLPYPYLSLYRSSCYMCLRLFCACKWMRMAYMLFFVMP